MIGPLEARGLGGQHEVGLEAWLEAGGLGGQHEAGTLLRGMSFGGCITMANHGSAIKAAGHGSAVEAGHGSGIGPYCLAAT